MADLKDFPYPLNTPVMVEEEVERVVPSFDPETKQVTLEKKKVKVEVETIFHHAPATSVSCQNGEHDFYKIEAKRYTIACHKCTKHIFINPIHHILKDGHLLDRKTKRIIA